MKELVLVQAGAKTGFLYLPEIQVCFYGD